MNIEDVYDAYYDRIYKMIYMYILNRQDTEDVVQDTFVRAVSAWSTYDPEKSQIQTWLFRIARNTMIDFVRKRKHRGQDVPLDDIPEEGTEDKELMSLTDSYAGEAYCILKQLNENDRELLMMRYGMELSYKEIAKETDSNEKAVGKRVERLLLKCRNLIPGTDNAKA